MRHLKSGRKLGRNSSHRKAMFRNMTVSLLKHGQIITTLAKAKELRGYVEPLITLAGKNKLSKLDGLSGDVTAKNIWRQKFNSAKENDLIEDLIESDEYYILDRIHRFVHRNWSFTRFSFCDPFYQF